MAESHKNSQSSTFSAKRGRFGPVRGDFLENLCCAVKTRKGVDVGKGK